MFRIENSIKYLKCFFKYKILITNIIKMLFKSLIFDILNLINSK
jgi:hypothetical protein